jgi:hypothetical protein
MALVTASPTAHALRKGIVALPLVDEDNGVIYGWDLHLVDRHGMILSDPVAEDFNSLSECREFLAQEAREFPAPLYGRRWRPSDLIRWGEPAV